jgi:hypothetical protein
MVLVRFRVGGVGMLVGVRPEPVIVEVGVLSSRAPLPKDLNPEPEQHGADREFHRERPAVGDGELEADHGDADQQERGRVADAQNADEGRPEQLRYWLTMVEQPRRARPKACLTPRAG